MIEPWMIEENRIKNFKNVYAMTSRNYEAGRERMIEYVVKILDNRKNAVLYDIQSMIELIEELIKERNNFLIEINRLSAFDTRNVFLEKENLRLTVENEMLLKTSANITLAQKIKNFFTRKL